MYHLATYPKKLRKQDVLLPVPCAPNTIQMSIDIPIQCSTSFGILLTFTN